MESRYTVCSNKQLPNLQKEVNDKLQAGWEITGMLFQDKDGNFYQPLTRETNTKNLAVSRKK